MGTKGKDKNEEVYSRAKIEKRAGEGGKGGIQNLGWGIGKRADN